MTAAAFLAAAALAAALSAPHDPDPVRAATAVPATVSAVVPPPGQQDQSVTPATTPPEEAAHEPAGATAGEPTEPEAWTPGIMTWLLAGVAGALAIRLGAWAARRRQSTR